MVFLISRNPLYFRSVQLIDTNMHATETEHKILREMPLFFSLTLIFSPAPPHELVTMTTRNDLSLIFQFQEIL